MNTDSEMLSDLKNRIKMLGDHPQYDIHLMSRSVVRETRGAARDGNEILTKGDALFRLFLEDVARRADELDTGPALDTNEVVAAALAEAGVTKPLDVAHYGKEVQRLRGVLNTRDVQQQAEEAKREGAAALQEALRLHYPAGLPKKTPPKGGKGKRAA